MNKNNIINGLLLLSLIICIYLTDETNILNKGFGRDFIDVFVLSPIFFLLFIMISAPLVKSTPEKDSYTFIIFTNLLSAFLVIFLLLKSLVSGYGLWNEWTHYDNHFSEGLQRDYYYSPLVGIIGIYISLVSNFTLRYFTYIYKNPTSKQSLRFLLVFIPWIGYYFILFIQQFFNKPYFIG